jgi:hypothetical protein
METAIKIAKNSSYAIMCAKINAATCVHPADQIVSLPVLTLSAPRNVEKCASSAKSHALTNASTQDALKSAIKTVTGTRAKNHATSNCCVATIALASVVKSARGNAESRIA